MPRTRDRAVLIWILSFASFAVVLVVLGGFVRLMRAGLSIVEWNPVYGALPPTSQAAWQAEFAKYQLSPEYQQINKGMTLAAYQEIFLIEWVHRLLARAAGLVFAVPFGILLWRRRIPLPEAPVYVLMGLLFLAQALMGWMMVASGLVERPSVSHYLLAGHLFLALSLIGLAVWTALGHIYGFVGANRPFAPLSTASKLAAVSTIGLLLQMAYGAFTAGLKAGHVSDTWPLMLGRLIPRDLFQQVQPPVLNLVAAPLTVAFIHRWLAFILLVFVGFVLRLISRLPLESDLQKALGWITALSAIQIGLGIAVVITRVDIAVALVHQANALALFVLGIYTLHRLRHRDAAGAA